MTTPTHQSSGGRLVSTAGKILPLTACALRVDAAAGLARVVLEQTFANPHDVPLAVTYKLPLPADAAVSGFAFRLGDRRIVGTVDKKRAARERYEQALLEGKSAALLEEERSSLFTQEIGNIPPGVELVAEITLDQPLVWTNDGSWELRFPLTAAPRYLGDQAEAFANVVVDVAEETTSPRASLVLAVRDTLPAGRSPESPSHPLVCVPDGAGFRVELGSQNRVPLDRDVVVRWPVAGLEPKVTLDVARPADGHPHASSAFASCTLVPPSPDARFSAVPRDLTLLVDTSGSMNGEPLAQAKRICLALVDGLREGDTLEMIEFSDAPRAFKNGPAEVTPALKKAASSWLRKLQASGGTEMLSGVRAALRDLRPESQRQVVIVTDGLVGFEQQIVAALLGGLPASCRFHAVGVGSAVNRSLLAPIARAGRGVEVVVGLDEDPERAAARLFARTVAPAVVNLTIEGTAVMRKAPARLPDLYAGAPARVALELRPEGGEVIVRGQIAGGTWEQRITVAPVEHGAGSEAVVKLFAREAVEDLEMRIASGERSLDAEIERLGLDFQISTRLTSWLALTSEATVDPRDPTREITVPNALPFGMSAEGLGLRAAASSPASAVPVQTMARAITFAGMAPSRPGTRVPPASPVMAPPPPSPMAPPRARMAPPAPGAPPSGPAFDEKARDVTPLHEPTLPESSRGLLGRVADFARDLFGRGSAGGDEPEPVSEGELQEQTRDGWLELNGKIVLRRGPTLVLEVVAPSAGLEVDHDSLEAFIVTADGRVIRVDLDRSRSTRPGRHATMTTIRFALAIDPESTQAESVTEVRITIATAKVRVTAR